jgi:hypothetical protein
VTPDGADKADAQRRERAPPVDEQRGSGEFIIRGTSTITKAVEVVGEGVQPTG